MLGAHQEYFTINGERTQVAVNFVSEEGFIRNRKHHITFKLDEYTNFEGNMQDFAKHKINEVETPRDPA